MTDFFVLLTVVAETFITFVIFVRHDTSARRAIPLSFTYSYFLRGALLVVGEKRAASKMPVTFGTGVANMGERTSRAGHAVATRLIAVMRDVTCT